MKKYGVLQISKVHFFVWHEKKQFQMLITTDSNNRNFFSETPCMVRHRSTTTTATPATTTWPQFTFSLSPISHLYVLKTEQTKSCERRELNAIRVTPLAQ